MSGELGLTSPAAFVSAEALAIYGIAINLAYLNLPTLRFPERIRSRINEVVNRYADVLDSVNEKTAQYKAIYELGHLGEMPELPTPTSTDKHDSGGVLVNIFMFIWSPVITPITTQPIDKLISGIFLAISNLYFFYILALQIFIEDKVRDSVLQGIFATLLVCVGVIAAVALVRRDFITGTISTLTAVYTYFSVYYPDSWRVLINPAFPQTMFSLLATSVLGTTVLVALSHILYPLAERHFVQETTDVLENAKNFAAKERHGGAGGQK